MDATVVLDQKTDTLTVISGKGEQQFITEKYRPGQLLVRSRGTHEVIGLQLIGFTRNWTSTDRVCDVIAEFFDTEPGDVLKLLTTLVTPGV